ncbi:WSC domain-containing protein like [Verticillium longisporum]|uniref:WSC domain-containing protein like n=1 Tax=Verticillium longisporum TaxID=100787 RepID=A0A8I2ZTZ9_VERLO|nr:WSC domain-containing protein like [Verticillium longisporum]
MAAVAGLANGLADTDTITWGGDNSRAGYQTNHNMDPAVVRSSQFDRIFQTTLPGRYGGRAEQIFSQPLVYTPDDKQYVYLATTQNNVYKLDAQTGEILASRNLHIPFLSTDLDGCYDIQPHVGVTGTGVIDPDTGTYYLLAKTYENQELVDVAQGRPAGRYYLHALDVNDLSERPNFPVDLEGTVARNNPDRSFNGGIHLQRPALLHVGQHIYAGLGSHCVKFNFTGWVMGWDKTTGEQVERFATQGEGVPQNTEGGGLWMAGGGLASDDQGSIFFATGNGYAGQLAEIPVNGRNPPTSLEEAAVHMTIQEDGSLDLVDFFIPWDKRAMDGDDKDLGSSPLQILPSEFSCGSIRRIGVVTGKNKKTYFINLDDMGGYRNGEDRFDNIIQTYEHENSVYAGAGVYPGEGGYIYINVVQYPTIVFRFSCANGVPSFNKEAETPESNGYTLGVSHGTVTSLNGEPGTAMLWTTDVQNPPGQLRIYDAVPRDGELTLLRKWEIAGVTKFSRAVFGDGIMYLGTTTGLFYGFGAPINRPIECTSPLEFGAVSLEASAETRTLTCTALINTVVNDISLREVTDFSISGLPTLPLTLAVGATFTIEAAFAPTDLGLLSTDVNIETENSVAGYRTTTSARLTGTGETDNPRLSVSPREIEFDNVITAGAAPPANNVVLSNQGNSVLTVNEIRYSETINGTLQTWDPASGALVMGPFTIRNIPSTIDANSGATVSVSLSPANGGTFSRHIRFITNGGNADVTMTAHVGAAPVLLVEFERPDGEGWTAYQEGTAFSFGEVTQNNVRNLGMRITNTAPAGGVRLSLTVSKPPHGGSGIIRANNARQWNMEPYQGEATWSLNTNDPTVAYQNIQFECTAVSEQENTPGRQLANQLYGNDENTIAMCVEACAAGNYVFCGTQYHRECWAGPTIPRERVADVNCNFDCDGDLNQICGGNGIATGPGGAYISLFADTLRFDGNETNIPDPEEPLDPTDPIVNPGVDGYISIGCYTEAPGSRALPFFFATEDQTVAMCVDACSLRDYEYAGVQYGGECWCANAITTGAVPAPDAECNMACNDNAAEYCGGGSRLNVYQRQSGVPTPGEDDLIGDWSFEGCYTEGDGVRALNGRFYADDELTLEKCAAFCEGFVYFGAEYGRECDCNFPCGGDGSQFCGAGNRLQMYRFGGADAPSGAVSSSLVVPTSAVVSSTVAVIAIEASTAPASSSVVETSSTVAVESSAIHSGIPSSTTPTSTPSPSVYPGNDLWNYTGCYSEPSPGRLLPSQLLNDGDEMDIELCLDVCAGYNYAGVEYGRECWCGDRLNAEGDVPSEGTAVPGERVDDDECVRMSVYILREHEEALAEAS